MSSSHGHRIELALSAIRGGGSWHLQPQGQGWAVVVDPPDGSRLLTPLSSGEVGALRGLSGSGWLPPTLVTERLVLRRPVLADAEPVFARWAHSSEVTTYLTWAAHPSVETTRHWLRATLDAWRAGRGDTALLCTHEDPRPIGSVRLSPEHGASLGYVVAPGWEGRGLATEAVRALSEHALGRVHRVWAVHDLDNPASGRVLQKSGFEREGVLRKWAVSPTLGPTPRDCAVWARVR